MINTVMLSNVRINIEDENAPYRFSDVKVYATLTASQLVIANLVNNNYLSELRYIDGSKTFSGGSFLLSGLTYSVLGGDEGIISVKANTGYFTKKLKMDELGSLNNAYKTGNNKRPIMYVSNGSIYLYPTTISLGDIHYYQVPTAIDASTSCILNSILHNAVVTYASSTLLASDNKLDRSLLFKKIVIDELTLLNQKYEVKKIEEKT